MKKIISALLCFVTLFILTANLTACNSSIQKDWSAIILGDLLPVPEKGKLNIGSNLNNVFSGSIKKVDLEFCKDYKNACIKKGYSVEVDEDGDRFKAFNKEAYELSLSFYNGKELNIFLKAPDELSEIEWPTNGIGSNLPATTSKFAKITSDSSKSFRITVGNTSLDDMNSYIALCKEKGFTIDYFKNETSYSAKNADGFKVNITYLGCNRIDVLIESGKNTVNNDSKSEIKSDDKISEEFKKAMDSYETFFNEYVEIMNKYKKSDGTDLSILKDYTEYLAKYSEVSKDFKDWESKNLNSAELKYYLEVQSRVSKKLLEIAS